LNGGTVENVTINVILGETRLYNSNTQYIARNAGAMFGYVNGGTLKNCTVNVTIPADITITNGYAITDISAFGQKGTGMPVMENCTATLVNNYNTDSIQMIKGSDLGTVDPTTGA
jgi:hypothetical protein